jgi:hypothetical protein
MPRELQNENFFGGTESRLSKQHTRGPAPLQIDPACT